jgi:NAD(P)-dependent dehydrogenase (short-subunit alcohol dehydrogenase family)
VTVTLITGADRGLGHETARRLLAEGHTVWMGARDPGSGSQAARELGGRFVQLDVTDPRAIGAAAASVSAEHGSLDVLVNNAGIAGEGLAVEETTVEQLRHVYETNVFGLVGVTQALVPLLLRSGNPVVVNVSSILGSIGATSDPKRFESVLLDLVYPSSKAAVNMLTSQYARAYPRMRINSVDPGYVITDLHPGHGGKTVEEGAEVIVWAASLGPDGPTGGFFDSDGAVPW